MVFVAEKFTISAVIELILDVHLVMLTFIAIYTEVSLNCNFFFFFTFP